MRVTHLKSKYQTHESLLRKLYFRQLGASYYRFFVQLRSIPIISADFKPAVQDHCTKSKFTRNDQL